MSDHSELVEEIASVEKMSTSDRLKHAEKRRSQQLKRFANYEKQLEKDRIKKNKQPQNQRISDRRKGVRFSHNIMLLEAASRNDVEEVRKLLMAKVSPNATNEDGLTALHQCCIDDSEEMLKLLLEFGAKVNAKDIEMWTPLHAAATCGHANLCKILIAKGAELLAVNADGNMPYDICEDEVCLDAIETEMAKKGITQEAIDEKRLETEHKMLNDLKKIAADKGDFAYRGKNLAAPLHVAAANGYLDVVEFLLNQHLPTDVQDKDGWLPIHAAACWLQPEVIEMLVKNGADIDAKTRNGDTAFDLAEDPDVKQKILDLKDELETHRASHSTAHTRNRRVNTRGSLIHRTSLRGEKLPLFKKEAQEEAKHFGLISNNDNDDDDDNDNDNNLENLRNDSEQLPETSIGEIKFIAAEDFEGHQQRHHDSESNAKHNDENVNKAKMAKPNKVVTVNSKTKELTTEAKCSHKPRVSCSGEKIARILLSTDSNHNKQEDVVHQRSGSSINGNDSELIHCDISCTSDTNPESDQLQESCSDTMSIEIRYKANIVRAASFQKKRESQKRRGDEYFSHDHNDDNTQFVGPLEELNEHQSEEDNSYSLDAQVQDLFLHSLRTEGRKYGLGSPRSSQYESKEHVKNGQNVKNNNNTSDRSKQTRSRTKDNEPFKKFSSPSSAIVIGSENDKFKNDCCLIM